MSSLLKKTVAGFTTLACAASMMAFAVAPAQAQTVEELQVQIAQLNQMIASLMAQIAALQGGTTPGGTITGCTITSFDRALSQGMTGDDVKCLQIILNTASDTQVATTGAGSPGSETSYFGPLTKAAVIKFQEKYAPDILATYGLTKGTGYVGPTTRAKLNSMLAGSVTPPLTGCTDNADCPAGYICSAGTCVAISGALTVTLAPDSPAGANLWKGSANNTVAKFNFYGGATATTITGLTLTNYGTTEGTGAIDLPAVKVFDESNIQQGVDRTVAGNKVVFVFVPAITVPANGSKTLTVAVNVGTGAGTLETVRLGIAAATDISGTTFAGTYPLAGNEFSIVPAGSTGSVTIGQYGSLPKTSVRIGEKDVVLEKFTISAGANEDVSINQITVKNDAAATISDSDISNIRVREVGGTTDVAGPGNLSSKKVTLNLATPYLITKGTAKNFEVIADIISGATATTQRTVRLYIDTGGVVGRGSLSGINMTSTGTTTANPVTIYIGSVVVTMSTNHPQGSSASLIKTSNAKTLAVFSVKAIGEKVAFSEIRAKFVGGTVFDGTNDITNVGLYVDDALISDLITVDTNNVDEVFTVNWTLDADTTKDVEIKGVTSSMSFVTSCTSTTSWSYYTGYGLSSGEVVTSDTDVASSALTIYDTGKVTVSADTTKTAYNQGIISTANNVTLGAIKVYAQREDQKLTDLVVTIQGTAYNDEADISTITLYDANGTTALSNPKAYDDGGDDTTDTFTFASSDFIDQITFTKAAYKTILVKANCVSGIDGTTALYLSIVDAVDQLKTEGLDSGTAYDFSTDAAATLDLKFTSPFAGGAFAFENEVLSFTKAAESPSGTISRSNQAVVAIWDLTNSTGTAFDIDVIKLTNKAGWDADLSLVDDNADETLFKLIDENGTLIAGGAGATAEIDLDTGTVEFTKANMITVQPDEPKQLKLVVDLTNTTKWQTDQQIQMTLAAVGDLTSSVGLAGYINGVWSIPADANIVEL